MNEAQTLLAIENLMKKLIKKTYHWQDLESELDGLSKDVELISDSNRMYRPLIQAYFDLLPKRIKRSDEEIFYRRAAFQRFQSELREHHEEFINEFCENNKEPEFDEIF